jgi:O-antigen ligase/Tfp pilus assembly protein PilF
LNRVISSTSATAAARWLALLAAASWLGYFICSGLPQTQPEVFRSTVAFQAVALVPAALFAGYLLLRRRLPGESPLDWPLLLLLAAYFVATVASVAWRVSLESTLVLLLAVLVFYALSDLHVLDAMGLQRAFMLAAAAASVWALWNVAGDYLDWLRFAKSTTGGLHLGDLIPPTVPKVHGVSDHPNILGMTLVLAMPFYVLGVYRSASLWLRAFWGLMLLAALWAVFFTLSRGAWIGAATAIILTVGGIAAAHRSWSIAGLRRAALAKSRTRLLLVAGGAVALLFIVVAGAVVATRWSVRPQWLFRESLSPRRDVFDAGVSIFRDHPLFGGGPGTFGLLYPEYSGAFPIHAIHAHNGFLQLSDDAGLAGLAALAVLLATLGWMLWQTYRRGSAEQRLLAVACAGALGGFAVHNLADAANIWKAALIGVAAVTAIAVKNYRSLPASDGAPPSSVTNVARRLGTLLPRGLLAIAFVALPLVWLRIDVAHRHYSHSVSQLALGNVTGAISEAKRAVDLDPDFAVYQLQLGLTEGIAFTNGDMTSPDRAIASLQRAVELEPRSAIGYANLAQMLASAGRNDEAQAAALQAKRFAGADDAVLLVAAGVLEDAGAENEAVQTYASAITISPSIADSRFWQESDFRSQHYLEIISYSLISLSPCATANLVAHIGRDAPSPSKLELPALRDSCRAAVAGDAGNLGGRIELAEISMALGDYPTAHDLLADAISRQPDLGRAHTVMGEWYAAQGDVTRAREEWTTGGQLDEAESLLLLGESYPAGQVPTEVVERLSRLAPSVGGGARSYAIGWVYYRMKFGRQEPAGNVLLPGDWLNAVPSLYDRIQQALERWRDAG